MSNRISLKFTRTKTLINIVCNYREMKLWNKAQYFFHFIASIKRVHNTWNSFNRTNEIVSFLYSNLHANVNELFSAKNTTESQFFCETFEPNIERILLQINHCWHIAHFHNLGPRRARRQMPNAPSMRLSTINNGAIAKLAAQPTISLFIPAGSKDPRHYSHYTVLVM